MKKYNKCKNCNRDINKRTNVFCNVNCNHEYKLNKKLSDYIYCNKPTSSRVLKKLLIVLYGNVCQECGLNSWNGKDIFLDFEHIDGDSKNNYFLNVTLLCPNCHSQTETYKGRNKGNGRQSRRKRYRDGKSY